MAVQGFPRVDFSIIDKKSVSLRGLFNSVLFILEAQSGYISDTTFTPVASGDLELTTKGADDVYADMNVIIEITTAGAVGTAEFKYSTDGGANYSEDILTSTDDISLDYGLVVTFADAGGTPEGAEVGDIYEFFVKKGFRKKTVQKLTKQDYDSKITHQISKQYLDAYFSEADECYVIAPPNDSAGSIGSDTGTSTGDGSIVVDGDPIHTGELKLEFITSGDIGVAEYLYYIDGVQISNEPALLTDTLYIPEANVTLSFTDGTDPSFVSGDNHIYALTRAGSSNPLLALTNFIATPNPVLNNNVKMDARWLNLVMPYPLSTEDMNKLKNMIQQRMVVNNFTGYVMQADYRRTASVENFKTTLMNNIQYFKDSKTCIILDWVNKSAEYTTIIPASIMFAIKIANYRVHIDPGVRTQPGLAIESRYDEDNMELIDEDLNNAGYVVLRSSQDTTGLFQYYFQNSHVLSQPGSNFINYQHVRTFFKCLKLTSFFLTGYLKSSIVATDGALSSVGSATQSRVAEQMIGEFSNFTFEILTTAEEFKSTGIIEARLDMDRLTTIERFVVNASLV